jgi:all-trans-retinol 13,14-reductase
MYDAIVIGSGIGGMTAAGLLAGVANKKVLVLEKHTEPGGLTHVFRRDGAAWDVGLHYVGEVGPGTQGRAFFDYLSGGDLRWSRMPERFERFVYPGIDISVPSDPDAYIQILTERFPQEADAIRGYFKDIRRATQWATLGFKRGMVPRPVAPILRWIQKLTGGLATRTTAEVLASRFRSTELRAVLASQWGDYGLPPSQSAFAIHAQIVSHYLNGAWYPEGGAARIARTFETGIERAGGSMLVAQEVTDILVENGKAVGVRVSDRRGPQTEERIYRAPVVISSVGAATTFERLLPTEGEVGVKTAAVRQEVQDLSGGFSAVTLYLRLRADPRHIGVHGENHWINTNFEHDDTTSQSKGVLQGSPRGIYVSFPSIKAKDEQFHTAEIIAFVDERAFAKWRDLPKGNRGADYSALKYRISVGLLRLADTHIPGLAGLVTYTELATPLTVAHYTSHPGGRFYGLAASPQRYQSKEIGPRTPIEGLYMAGQDAGCVGIFGAMMGGVGAACQVIGARGFPMIKAALKAGPVRTPPSHLPDQKKRAVLVAKRALTATTWQLEFQVDGPIKQYAPGQFARLHVGGGEWRDYSIAGLDNKTVRFLISTRTGGHGSRFVQDAALLTETHIELPLGQYTLSRSGRRQVFVATGTGLAPFLPMFHSLQADGTLGDAVLLFGYKTEDEDITTEMSPLSGHVIRCISRGTAPSGGHEGRGTDALTSFEFDPDKTDFYLCGSSTMVADSKATLEIRGAKHLFTESF